MYVHNAEQLQTTLQQQNLYYTWDLLLEQDYDEFWYGYMVSDEPVPVRTMLHYAVFWSSATLVATVLLWQCLGCKLWFKY